MANLWRQQQVCKRCQFLWHTMSCKVSLRAWTDLNHKTCQHKQTRSVQANIAEMYMIRSMWAHIVKERKLQKTKNCQEWNKKAQLSLTNPRDAKACQKLLQFDVLTTLSLTILAYLHSFSCCCVRNLQNRAKFTENSNLWSSRSSKVIDLGVNQSPCTTSY